MCYFWFRRPTNSLAHNAHTQARAHTHTHVSSMDEKKGKETNRQKSPEKAEGKRDIAKALMFRFQHVGMH